MNGEREAMVLRHRTGWTRADHVHRVRLAGPQAYEALDGICPRELYLRNGQMMQSVLLDPDGRVFADLLVCNDDDEFILCVEGPDRAGLMAYLAEHTAPADVELVDLDESHRIVSLNGPWAWEVMSELAGATLIGLPYMTFYHAGSWVCMRAGKTGEFGYDILAPAEEVDPLIAALEGLAERLGVAEVGLEALDQCALENCFFSIRREGAVTRDPRELQLHWRLSTTKQHLAAEALARPAAEPPRLRTSTLLGAEAMQVADEVFLDGHPVGRVANAGYCWHRAEHVALALIETRLAQPGIATFRVGSADGPVARSVAPPVLNNRSLYINPQLHSYATRDEVDFPPLVLEGWP